MYHVSRVTLCISFNPTYKMSLMTLGSKPGREVSIIDDTRGYRFNGSYYSAPEYKFSDIVLRWKGR